ncbi:SGNH/GDSL hydrolase family protein [Oceanomicrobium pacificus]|uniref:SGNH/GDSL hydrolase family protein n=1 Tax=Oceanomicrobium pacificus TaxID=2692916 RepID=A0A6B0TP19_9RHOB|nr:SGNH/GDSL hydrolase family protein [Oceanomicrobium pacificus]MXU64339.1 SGNH/GDSL hydrolase family protein [Oceanomicrobium pacificus]
MVRDGAPSRAALWLCLLPAAYFALVALYAALNFSDYASDTPRLLRYIVGPLAISAMLVLCAFFLSSEAALSVGITASSILFALFLFEAVMTYRLLPKQAGLAGIVDGELDADRFADGYPPAVTVKAMNRDLGVETLSDAILTGIPEAEVLLCSKNGAPVSYRADALGLRNPAPEADAPVEILLLGDSFAEGICLPDGTHLADRMRASGLSLVNTGSRGMGPLLELAVLKRFGPHFRPDMTLMLFFEGNDWTNLENELQRSWLSSVLDGDVDAGPVRMTDAQEQAARDMVGRWWDGSAASIGSFLKRQSVLRNFLALHHVATALGLHYPKALPEIPAFADVLVSAKETAAVWGGEFTVIYLPAVDRFGGLLPHDFVHDPLREMVADAAAGAGVGLIDLVPPFEATGAPRDLYAADAHLNAAGAQLAADHILRALRDQPTN